jgi:hypothetical protein
MKEGNKSNEMNKNSNEDKNGVSLYCLIPKVAIET